MSGEYSIYCDESCHLENDKQKSMVLGGVWAEGLDIIDAVERIKELKVKHGISQFQEVKWTKVSPSNQALYLDLVDYFFDNSNLHFRGLVVPDKSIADHKSFNQTHDDWYYKMYFLLLTAVLSRERRYDVYLDIKDTRGGTRVRKLREVLSNSMYDFEQNVVRKVQLVRSHEVQLLQLTDILIGALMYKHRGEYGSLAKKTIVQRIEERSGLSLTKNTLLTEDKFNLLIWRPEGVES